MYAGKGPASLGILSLYLEPIWGSEPDFAGASLDKWNM